MNSLKLFNTEPFIIALKAFFEELKVPVDYLADEPASPTDILGERFKATNEAHKLIEDVFALGVVNNAIFDGTETFKNLAQVKKLTTDYDGLLIFGITLNSRPDRLLPTRSQLAEITRIFNRVFTYTPVTIVFKYDTYISFANSERVKYLQEWREGEKVGKVSLLRDINFRSVHAGHYKILNDLTIARTGKNAINSFSELYKYWQSTLSVSILNRAFYGELQNWYFWALQEVHFPNPPLRIDFSSDSDFDEAIKEHKGKNVIRLLTRILFIWFIKEKGLIPEEIFDEKVIADRIINEFVPQKPEGLFLSGKQNSKYYRAILQNLFFATINQPCKQRDFRADGKHQNVTQLMRYKSYFKDPEYFIELMEAKVPFMNGGLFECLDKPHETLKGKQGGDRIIYVDGFSDKADNDLLVPDFLFFDADEEVDLSKDYGNTKYKKSKTRGLITILKSYKFTITENTPIDEEVALDPELLGKVFENLLASYNPETKTTARKQTGSFYTPREIVDYMVDESLIAYLKNHISAETEKLDEQLHQLVSYSSIKPFAEDEATQKAVIKALDKCTILDPACGSGAYPMGILQKMVHILHKIDPNNTEWKNRQLQRVDNAIVELEQLDDTTLREITIRELEAQKRDIEESFTNNELDYGRKLYLIENCIFGVDIQPIATQISKLRFFISLVVDQKVDAAKDNFGVRPLPNLETKFVAANTLIGIEKPQKKGDFFGSLFDKNEVQKLEKDLKKVRQRLFSAKTPSTKRTLREQDKTLREQMGDLLVEEYGNATARQLANWDPYDQNTTSPFFDKEWMFDIREGFDIVIGNPPYIKEYTDRSVFDGLRTSAYYQGKMDLWYFFTCVGIDLLKENGTISYIAPNNWTTNSGASKMRNKILEDSKIMKLVDFGSYMIFESADIQTMILFFEKNKKNNEYQFSFNKITANIASFNEVVHLLENQKNNNNEFLTPTLNAEEVRNKTFSFSSNENDAILNKIKNKETLKLTEREVANGIHPHYDYVNKNTQQILGSNYKIGQGIFVISDAEKESLNLSTKEEVLLKPYFTTEQIQKWYGSSINSEWIIYTDSSFKNSEKIKPFPSIKKHLDQFQQVITSDNRPYGLHRARVEDFFIGEKIITLRKCVGEPKFTYTNFDCYVSATFYVIKTNRLNQKYLTAFLNSKIIAFWLKNKGKMQGNNYQLDKEPLLEIPIFKPTDNVQQPFIDLLDKILECKRAGDDTQAWEAEIDLRVYKLYELTHAEVLVIDPAFGMSAAEYELLAY